MASLVETSTTLQTSTSLETSQGAYPILQVEASFDQLNTDAPQFVGITSFVRQAQSQVGRQTELDQASAATATLTLDNRDGRFEHDNPSSPYYPYLTPMRRIRLFVEWDGARYPVYNGFVSSWLPAWPSMTDDTVTIQAVDGFDILTQADIVSTAFGSQSSIDRVRSVLDWGGVAISRDVPASGSQTLPAETVDGTDPLSYIHDVEQTEMGFFYMKPSLSDAALARFEESSWRSVNETTTRLVLGDSPSDGETGYQDLVLDGGTRAIINSAVITPAGDSPVVQTIEDTTSVQQYGRRSIQRTLKTTSDSYAYQVGQALVAAYKDATIRVRGLTIQPAAVPIGSLAAFFAVPISGRVLVRRRPSWSGEGLETSPTLETSTGLYTRASNRIEQDAYVESQAWTFTPHYSGWTTTWTLSPATAATYWILGSGLLDSTAILA